MQRSLVLRSPIARDANETLFPDKGTIRVHSRRAGPVPASTKKRRPSVISHSLGGGVCKVGVVPSWSMVPALLCSGLTASLRSNLLSPTQPLCPRRATRSARHPLPPRHSEERRHPMPRHCDPGPSGQLRDAPRGARKGKDKSKNAQAAAPRCPTVPMPSLARAHPCASHPYLYIYLSR